MWKPTTILLRHEKEEKNAIIEICPVRNVIARFGNKWALLVILILSENKVLRFNELGRLIPDVSSRVLSGTLRTLEADGLVERTVYPTVPPKVEYRLTETGASLVPFIVQLTEWAEKNLKPLKNSGFTSPNASEHIISDRLLHPDQTLSFSGSGFDFIHRIFRIAEQHMKDCVIIGAHAPPLKRFVSERVVERVPCRTNVA